MKILSTLVECTEADVGRKGANLRRLELRGYTIPKTWIIPGSLQEEVVRLSGAITLKELAQRVILPDELAVEIGDLLQNMPRAQFVVRSSSNVEDLPFANAAGQYESFLGLDNVDAIISAIIQCYKAVADPHVMSYLERHGIDTESQRMSILIQEMIFPEWAGVIYSRAPLSQENVIIEYVPGLGISVVAGRHSPGWALVNRQTGVVNGTIPEAVSSHELLSVALNLEAEFASPQDIEWGWAGRLVLFQSRNIVPLKQVLEKRKFDVNIPPTNTIGFRPFGPGMCIGRLVTDISENSVLLGQVLVGNELNKRVCTPLVMDNISGVISTSGGVLSHFAALCRELNLPGGVCESNILRNLISQTIVVDCDGSVVYPANDLDTVSRKKLVFDWAWTLADRPGLSVERHSKVEGVITEGELVRTLMQHLLSLGIEAVEVVQVIEPFDLPNRAYCGISVRIQHEPSWCRLQFKRVMSSTDGVCRSDEEVLVHFDNPELAREVLVNLGYIQCPVQQRALLKYSVDNVRIQFNLWPGALGVYAGIEAPNEAVLRAFLTRLGMSIDSCSALDGVDLFRMFGISLENCQFPVNGPLSITQFVLGG
jgi:phosphohistidine swiveling domain-containing protein/adenylate cyclase class IV